MPVVTCRHDTLAHYFRMCISNYSSLRGDKLKPSCRCFFSIPFGTCTCKRSVCIVWVIISDHRTGFLLLKGTWFKQGWIVIFRNHKHWQIMVPSEVENKAVFNCKTQDLHALRDQNNLILASEMAEFWINAINLNSPFLCPLSSLF